MSNVHTHIAPDAEQTALLDQEITAYRDLVRKQRADDAAFRRELLAALPALPPSIDGAAASDKLDALIAARQEATIKLPPAAVAGAPSFTVANPESVVTSGAPVARSSADAASRTASFNLKGLAGDQAWAQPALGLYFVVSKGSAFWATIPFVYDWAAYNLGGDITQGKLEVVLLTPWSFWGTTHWLPVAIVEHTLWNASSYFVYSTTGQSTPVSISANVQPGQSYALYVSCYGNISGGVGSVAGYVNMRVDPFTLHFGYQL